MTLKITQIFVVYNEVPYVVVEFDEVTAPSGTQTVEVEFNELGNYIALLTQQQTALGKFVNFDKGSYVQNNTSYPAVIIAASDAEPVTPQINVLFRNLKNVGDFLVSAGTSIPNISNWANQPVDNTDIIVTGTGVVSIQFTKTAPGDDMELATYKNGVVVDTFAPIGKILSAQYFPTTGDFDEIRLDYATSWFTQVINDATIDFAVDQWNNGYQWQNGAATLNAGSVDNIGLNMDDRTINLYKSDATTAYNVSRYRTDGTLIDTTAYLATDVYVPVILNEFGEADFVRTVVISEGAPTPPTPSGNLTLISNNLSVSITDVSDLTPSGFTFPVQNATQNGVWSGFAGGILNVGLDTIGTGFVDLIINAATFQTQPYNGGSIAFTGVPAFANGDSVRIRTRQV